MISAVSEFEQAVALLMMVTRTPRTANDGRCIRTPITPPPTTISERGSTGRSRMWSLLTMERPLMGTWGRVAAGLVLRPE